MCMNPSYANNIATRACRLIKTGRLIIFAILQTHLQGLLLVIYLIKMKKREPV